MHKLEDTSRQVDLSLELDSIIYKISKTGLISRDIVQYEIETKFPKLITSTIPLYRFSTNLSPVNVNEVLSILKDSKVGLKNITLDKYQRVSKFINWIKNSPSFKFMYTGLNEITLMGKNTNKQFILDLFNKFPKTIYTEEKEMLIVKEMSFYSFIKELTRLLNDYQLSDTEKNKFKYYFDPILEGIARESIVQFLSIEPEDEKRVSELKLLILNMIKYYIQLYPCHLKKDTKNYLKTIDVNDLDNKITKILVNNGYTIEFLELLFLYSDVLVSIFEDLLNYNESMVMSNPEFFDLLNNSLLDYQTLEFENNESTDTRLCETVDMYHKLLMCLLKLQCTCEDENQDVDLEQ